MVLLNESGEEAVSSKRNYDTKRDTMTLAEWKSYHLLPLHAFSTILNVEVPIATCTVIRHLG